MIRFLACVAAAAALTGCASLDTLDANVSTFSRWPAGRAPATYAFERLPSQQANPQASQVLEDSARRAVEGAGFVPAGEGTVPDVSVQVGARLTATERSPFYDPFWYGGFGGYGWYGAYGGFYRPYHGRYGRGYWGPGWRYGAWWPGYDFPYYEREVAVLIRDKKSGEPLYEGRANSDGTYSDVINVLPAMFSAALQGFPNGGTPNPRRVRVSTTTTTQ